MSFSILCALIASFSYALFSRCYEPAVRKVSNPRHAAIILYALAGIILACLSGMIVGFSSQKLPLWQEVTFFSLPVSGVGLLVALCIGLLSMTVLYTVHIETEASSRRSMNMGLYSIIFQLNVLIIAFVDFLLFRPTVSTTNWIGSAVILISTITGMLIHAHSRKDGGDVRLNVIVLRAAVVSAISCGLALLIDGEIVRNLVFTREQLIDSLSLFVAYEALTFIGPSLMLLIVLRHSSIDKWSFRTLAQEFLVTPAGFSFAALFSALQFVFSVLALALPGPRLIPAAILGIAPFLCVLFDNNRIAVRIVLVDLLLAAVVALGIILVAI